MCCIYSLIICRTFIHRKAVEISLWAWQRNVNVGTVLPGKICSMYSLIICRAFTHRKVLNLSIHGLSTFIVRNVRVHITSENQFTYLKIKFDKVFVERRINPFKRTRVSTGKKQSKKVIGVQIGEKSENQVDFHLSQIKYLFRGECSSLIGAVLEKNRFF